MDHGAQESADPEQLTGGALRLGLFDDRHLFALTPPIRGNA